MLIFGLDFALMMREIHEVKLRSTVLERLTSECSKRNPSTSNLDFLAFAIDVCSNADNLYRKEASVIYKCFEKASADFTFRFSWITGDQQPAT